MRTDLPRKLYGNCVVLAAALSHNGIAYRDPRDLRRMRDWRVRRIVVYAAETVPFYQEWFREQGIDPREIRTAEDLEELPILDKSTVSQDPERFRSTSPNTGDRSIGIGGESSAAVKSAIGLTSVGGSLTGLTVTLTGPDAVAP